MLADRLRHVIATALNAQPEATEDERRAIYERARRQLYAWAKEQHGDDTAAIDGVISALEQAIMLVEADYAPRGGAHDTQPPSAAEAVVPLVTTPEPDEEPKRQSPDADAILEMFEESGPGGGEGAIPTPETVKRKPSGRLVAAVLLLSGVAVVVLAQPSTTSWMLGQVAGLTGVRVARDIEQAATVALQENALLAASKTAFMDSSKTASVVMIEKGEIVRATAAALTWKHEGYDDQVAEISVPEYDIAVRVEASASETTPQHLYVMFHKLPTPLLRGRRPSAFIESEGRLGDAVGDVVSLNATTLMYGINEAGQGVSPLVALGAELTDGTKLTVILSLPRR